MLFRSSPTLLSLLDSCRTGMGSRALRQWLLHPKRERHEALARHEAIATFLSQGFEGLREALRQVSDVERIAARVAAVSGVIALVVWLTWVMLDVKNMQSGFTLPY